MAWQGQRHNYMRRVEAIFRKQGFSSPDPTLVSALVDEMLDAWRDGNITSSDDDDYSVGFRF